MPTQFTIEIDEMGRVILAPELLSALRLSPGTALVSELKEGRIVLEPLPEDPELIEKDGLLVVRPRITGNIANWVQQDRDDRITSLIREFR